MKEELISIIVPVYRVEQYLRKCVDSIINQTYRNLEILLVDDGSPDLCGEICDEYARHDTRIKVIHKKNGGLSDARNAAIDVAAGDYIMFVDSDDWIELNACETIINYIHKNTADIVCYGIRYVYESGSKDKIFATRCPGMINPSTAIGNVINYSGGVGNYACNKMYKKDLFHVTRFPVGKVYEDSGTTYKLFHDANRIFVTDVVLYNYYIRGSSISDNKYEPQGFLDRLSLWVERLDFLRQYYPEHVDAQMALMVGEMQIGLIKLRNSDYYTTLRQFVDMFYDKYHPDIHRLSGCNRKIWLYYHLPLVFKLYVRCINNNKK